MKVNLSSLLLKHQPQRRKPKGEGAGHGEKSCEKLL